MPSENKRQPELRFKGFTDDWEQRKFSMLVQRISVNSSENNLPRIEYEDIIPGQGLLNKDINAKGSSKKGIRFIPGDILFGKLRPYLKNWYFSTIDGIAVGDWWVLRPFKVNSRFIFYMMHGIKFQMYANMSTGTKMPRSDWNTVSNVKYFLPSDYQEQNKIASLLNEIDKIIALHQQKSEQIQSLKNTLLQNIIPSNLENVPKLRFNDFTAEWNKIKLGEIVIHQLKGKAKADKIGEGLTEYLDTNRLNGGTPVLTNLQSDVKKEDILILWDGSKAGTVYSGFEGALGSTLKAYRTNESSGFVYQYLRFHQEKIYHKYRTPNIPHVQKDFLDVFDIQIPEINEQKIISDLLENLDELIVFHLKKIENIKKIKQTALQKMLI